MDSFMAKLNEYGLGLCSNWEGNEEITETPVLTGHFSASSYLYSLIEEDVNIYVKDGELLTKMLNLPYHFKQQPYFFLELFYFDYNYYLEKMSLEINTNLERNSDSIHHFVFDNKHLYGGRLKKKELQSLFNDSDAIEQLSTEILIELDSISRNDKLKKEVFTMQQELEKALVSFLSSLKITLPEISQRRFG